MLRFRHYLLSNKQNSLSELARQNTSIYFIPYTQTSRETWADYYRKLYERKGRFDVFAGRKKRS